MSTSVDSLIKAAPGEEMLLGTIDGGTAWELVEQFAELVRETGTEAERRAAELIVERLEKWGIPHTVFEPELLVSLPRVARLVVGDSEFVAKTPSMAGSTGQDGVMGELVHQPTPAIESLADLFAGPSDLELVDVAGKIVLVDGLQFPGIVPDLEQAGARAVVCVSPSSAIHESVCSAIWGAPDLTSWGRKLNIPVLNVSNETGERLRSTLELGAMASVVAHHEESWVKAPLIVAVFEGAIEPQRFVLLHGHLDSWHAGIGDNATGDGALLEVARAFSLHRELLPRTLRIAWWPGHSQGRYAGSTWYADAFALDIEDNCICHINCDSPGCRDADAFDEVEWMAELGSLAKAAIFDVTGLPSAGIVPPRAGDLSFSNIGVSTAFMASSNIAEEVRRERGLYPVGGCGGNVEWHTEADTIDVGDRERLLRDTRIYAAATLRAVASPVHPFDFRDTVDQIDSLLEGFQSRFGARIDLAPSRERLAVLRGRLDDLYAAAATITTVPEAAEVNEALLGISRDLVPVLYAREPRYRQDPAASVPLLPDFTNAEAAIGTAPDGVVRTELVRSRNRLDRAIVEAARRCRRALE